MLTALGQLDERVRGLDAGANDYLLKPFEFDELEARLRALTRDYSPRGGGLPIGSWTLYLNDHSIDSPYSGRITLSAQETALLATLGGRPNTVFSREQLLDAVGSTDGQVGTIDTYVHHLRRKTDRDLIETVRGRGYRSGTPA
jgi:two-component system response regulator QseB